MSTITLQIRVDNALKREADALFADVGMDTTTAVRLFLRQAVIRRALPFEVIAPDPFHSDANKEVLMRSIAQLEQGGGAVRTLSQD